MLSIFSPTYIAKNASQEGLKEYNRFLKGKVLDDGCGLHRMERFLNYAKAYVGIDIDKTLKSVDVIADGKFLPFSKHSFDSAISIQILEHIDIPLNYLKEVNFVLKKGGYFYFTVPFVDPLHMEPYDFFRYTEYGVRSLCKDAGFEIVRIQKKYGFIAILGYIINWLVWQKTIKISEWLKMKGFPSFVSKFPLRIFYPFYALSNIFSLFMDKLIPIKRIPLRYACLAKKVK